MIANVTSKAGKRHHWLWLTKRPERMATFSAWLLDQGIAWSENLWAGTSITTQATTSRIDCLLKVGDEKTIRFLSVEPQVEPIDLREWLPKLDWVIQGGESGPKGRPFDLAWADDMIDQCRQHSVPLFIKQLGSLVTHRGERLAFQDGHASDWTEWTEEAESPPDAEGRALTLPWTCPQFSKADLHQTDACQRTPLRWGRCGHGVLALDHDTSLIESYLMQPGRSSYITSAHKEHHDARHPHAADLPDQDR